MSPPTAGSAEELLKPEAAKKAEQRELDRLAYRHAHYDQKISPRKKTSMPYSDYSDEIETLRKKHPTLLFEELNFMWFRNTFSVPMKTFVKKEKSSKLNEKQVEQFNEHVEKEQSSTTIKEKGLSSQQVDEQLQLLRNELTSLKAAKKEIEEQKQMEINVLKRELETLKKEHEKTVAKLKVAEDVSQRDHTLEQKLVSLAEAMLVVKRDNEANFKKLKRRVKKSDGASELEHLKDKLLKTQKELEAKNVLIEELQKAEPSKPMKMVDEPETKYVKAEELQRSLDGEEEVKLLEKAARENLTKLLFKEMFGEDFELEGTVLKEQDEAQKVLAGGASESESLKEELLNIKEELEAKNVLIEDLQNSLRKKEMELAQKSDKEEQLMAKKKELEQHIQIVKSTTLMLNEQTENLKKVKAELMKKKRDEKNMRMHGEPKDDTLPVPLGFLLIVFLISIVSIIFTVAVQFFK